MRTAVFLTVLLALGAAPAAAEETVLADEWTAEFEAGVKVGWAHQRITEQAAGDGEKRYVLVSRGWTPVGDETIVEEERVETDARGRVLTYRMQTTGPRGAYDVAVEGRDYNVSIRDLAPVRGTLAKDAYDVGVILALIRRGRLPPGAKRVNTLNLPGDGLKERAFSMGRSTDEHWTYSRGDLVVVRNAEGELIETSRVDAPRWSRRRTTAARAPDRSVRDPAAAERAVARADGRTTAVTVPVGAWILRTQKDSYVTMTGLEHPLQVLVAVLEFSVPMGETRQERLGLAANVRVKLNEQGRLPTLGAPSLGTFGERPSVHFPLLGTLNMEPVAGSAHLVRSRTGQAVLVLGFHAKDMAERCRPLLDLGWQQVHLDAAKPRGPKWRRIKPSSGGLTLEIPGHWLRAGMENRWVSPQKGSQVRVNEGRLPADVDMAAAQRLWAGKLGNNPKLKDVQLQSTTQIDVAGVAMHKSVVTATLPREGERDRAMTTVSIGRKRDDGTYIEIVAVAFDHDWKAEEIDRLTASVRWEPRK